MNVCANGSSLTTWVTFVMLLLVTFVMLLVTFVISVISCVIKVLLITTGIGGGGGIRTTVVDCSSVSTTPLVVYTASAEVIETSPKPFIELFELEVSLNVLLPFVNLKGGTGSSNGSLKKNDPLTSPNTSEINLIPLPEETDAWALLVLPTITTSLPVLTYPENLPCASSAKESISIFKIVDEAEYAVCTDTSLSYGLVVYILLGVFVSPDLWFGWQILKDANCKLPAKTSTVSPLVNTPLVILISNNFGITSIPPVLSKKE